MEVAWQAYYDPHKVDLSDFVAPGRQDLSYLGLELVVRCDSGTDSGTEAMMAVVVVGGFVFVDDALLRLDCYW